MVLAERNKNRLGLSTKGDVIVEVTYDEIQEDEDRNRPSPLSSLAYGNGRKATFTLDSAREGIGDRNIMGIEDAGETEIQSPFGPMYLVYTPKGKNGRKIVRELVLRFLRFIKSLHPINGRSP